MRKAIAGKLRKVALESLLGPLPTRILGKTGRTVSAIGLGGESLLSSEDKQDEAIGLIRRAVELGINYFDTAPGYEPSEKYLGIGLQGVDRGKIVLASKTDKRDRDGAMKQLEQSLKLLKTDYLDVWQIHHIDHQDEVKQIFAKDGAMQALQEAKEQGMVRNLGVTGHYDPTPLVSCMKQFEFDVVLMVTNAADVHKHSMILKVMPEAQKQKMGIVGMKVCSRGRLFDPRHINSMGQALAYVLTLPISTVIIGHDGIQQLEQNVQTAKLCEPLSDAEMKKLEDMTKEYAHLALFFRKGCEEHNPFWSAYGYKREKKK